MKPWGSRTRFEARPSGDLTVARKFTRNRLVIATHNAGKAAEIADLVAPCKVTTVAASELGLEEPEETGETFAANAELKSLAAARATGLVAVADDSGLVVSALDGRPGIHSARWAGPDRDFTAAMEKIEAMLGAAGATSPEARAACFICVLSLAWPDGHRENFEGRVQGSLIWPPRGTLGFGYDPVFQPLGLGKTFGEMAPRDKHAISHRAVAFQAMIDACFRD